MFKTLIFFVLFFLTSHFHAQIVDTSSENYKAIYDEDGNLSSEGYIDSGKPNGYWITYYPNQLRQSEGNRVDFMLDGPWIFYRENGNIKQIINYKNDKKNGKSSAFDEACFLLKEENYRDGILHGKRYIFYPDSSNNKVKSMTPYVDGLEEGLAFEYAKDGRLITVLNYQKGQLAQKEIINRYNQQGEKQGVWKEYFGNNRLKKEERFKQNLLNGYVKYYNVDGKLDSAILYLDGIRQNQEENVAEFNLEYSYYSNGEIKAISSYNLSGQKEGVTTKFSESGEVLETAYYLNGRLTKKGLVDKKGLEQGLWESYYLSGELRSRGKYLNGKKIGKWVYYFRNGKIEQEGYFDNTGRYTGLWKWYYENGNLLRSEEYLRGIEDGEVEEFAFDGKLITKGEYIEGEKEGEWFYELNDHREEGKYRYGNRNGNWIYYYPNGKIAFKGSFIDGQAEGKHQYFYENGVLEKEEKYNYGEKNGKWKWYDKNGIEKLTIQYKDDIEKKIDGKRVKFSSK